MTTSSGWTGKWKGLHSDGQVSFALVFKGTGFLVLTGQLSEDAYDAFQSEITAMVASITYLK